MAPVGHRHDFFLDSILEKRVFLTLFQPEKGELRIIRNKARALTFGREGEAQNISWTEFTTVEKRVGRIVSAALFSVAGKPAYLLQFDFGGEVGRKQSCAQNTHLSKRDGL